MNNLVERADGAAEDKELHDAFTELGTDPEMSDVEFAFQVQADVALRD